MARIWPYEFHANWEDNSAGIFNGTNSDGSLQASIAHYTSLAREGMSPYSGAYCARFTLVDTTDAAYYEFDASTSPLDTEIGVYRLRFFLAQDFGATADDGINIFNARGANLTAAIRLDVNANGDVFLGHGRSPWVIGTEALERGVWYTVESQLLIDSAVGTNGTQTTWYSKEGDRVATSLGVEGTTNPGHQQVTTIRVGPSASLSTTTGTILIDDFFAMSYAGGSAVRVPVDRSPFRPNRWLGRTEHLFVGPGKICDVQMTAGNTAGAQYLEIYDTDTADTTDLSRLRMRLDNSDTTAGEVINTSNLPIDVQKGCYVVLSPNTIDDARLTTLAEPSANFVVHPRYNSRALVMKLGLDRGYRSTN